MMIFKRILIGLLLCSLAGCGVGEFLIKRSVNGLESDIADEFKSFARFNDQQEQQIDEFAHKTAIWMRTQRLPILAQQLELMARDVEANAELSESTWRSFVLFMEDPIEFSSVPDLLVELATVAHSMSEEQVQQALKKLDKEHRKEMKERRKLTGEDQNDKIMKGVKTVFDEIGIARTKAQLEQARKMLDERRDYIDLYTRQSEENYARFTQLLTTRGGPINEYRTVFTEIWKETDRSPSQMVPEDWKHNFRVSHTMMNYLLSDITAQERQAAAQKIRDYAALFTELSVMQ